MTAMMDAGLFRCTECGHETGKWMGFCAQCRTQGTITAVTSVGGAGPTPLAEVGGGSVERRLSGLTELDRTLGGGLVAGAAIVLGGEPGVGKSTLVLQAAAGVANSGGRVLIASAEESAEQVAMRSRRLGGRFERVDILSTTSVDEVIEVSTAAPPALLVVDSIQSVATAEADGSAGAVGQVRECGARLVAFAKRSGTPVLMIGHVTKEGSLAGPKLLEHVVDVVLYLEGDAHGGFRMLRGLKNRFGSTPALGFFAMGDRGLEELPDPGGVLRAGAGPVSPGSVLFPAVEGRRPLIVEVQALVAASASPVARRSVKGIEAARLHQVLAVLERHGGIDVAGRDVYVSVVGGVRVREPAADLAVALAVASSHLEVPLPGVAAWGEVGLTGELRTVSGGERRVSEAERLGASRVVAPGPNTQLLADALRTVGLWGAEEGG